MDGNFQNRLVELLDENVLKKWENLIVQIDTLFDMEKKWNKGFGNWEIEYKYRRGGKTLCTLYAQSGSAVLLFTLGKAEREKFEAQRCEFSMQLQKLYDDTTNYHDGKWLWIPIDETLSLDDVDRLLRIKRRPNRKNA